MTTFQEQSTYILEELLREQVSANEIRERLEVTKNSPITLRLQFANVLLYTYDLTQGPQVEKEYERVMAIVEKTSGMPGLERLVTKGKLQEGDRHTIAWYATQF